MAALILALQILGPALVCGRLIAPAELAAWTEDHRGAGRGLANRGRRDAAIWLLRGTGVPDDPLSRLRGLHLRPAS